MVGNLLVLAAVLAAAVGLGWWMVASLRSLYGPGQRDKDTSALGNALQEFDRLVARPSIEYKIEAERPARQAQDASGDP